MKLYAFGTWNHEEGFYDFAGHVVADTKEEADLKANNLFPDDYVDSWEVKVDGYEIKLVKDGE